MCCLLLFLADFSGDCRLGNGRKYRKSMCISLLISLPEASLPLHLF